MAWLISLIALGTVLADEPADKTPPATPPVLAAFGDSPEVTTRAEWEARVPALRDAFADQIYGCLPESREPVLIDHKTISSDGIMGASAAGEFILEDPILHRHFSVAYILPTGDGPHPVIMQFSFCGNPLALGGREAFSTPFNGTPEFCSRFENMPPPEGDDPFLISMPVERLLAKGMAVVSIYPGDVIPDDREKAIPLLEKMSPADDPAVRPGAITAWGWVASLAVTQLETDSRFDPDRMAVMGHSRNGKAAFAAMLFDPRIDLLWAHQSGTGGATLNRSYEGESIENITGGFPHWFAPAYRDNAGHEAELPIDQHMALGTMAPRLVLFGGGWDDLWAGPMGAYRTAEGADPAYELYGLSGLDQTDPEEMNASADIAVFIRDGTHGTKLSDWEKFIAFASQHFGLDE
ncbi:hypothetical protein [Parvularcula marina]|uniref:glucuronyl esterase domain-containing protein n=1 Tax=Parvularcula marina TaxID=2292771 RepID=UPI00351561AF